MLERNKSARHEPYVGISGSLGSIGMVTVEGTAPGGVLYNTSYTASVPVQYQSNSIYLDTSSGYINQISNTGIENFTGQYSGSNLYVSNEFPQIGVSSYIYPWTSSVAPSQNGGRNIMFTTYSLDYLLNNVTGSVIVTGSINVNGFVYKNGNKQFNYGQWASLETQTGSANTAYAMKLEVPVPEFEGIYVGNNGSGFPTRIYAQNTGLYNIQFSAQLHTTANQSCDFSVWFAMTGSNIANSNTDFSIEKVSGGGFQVAALNFLTPITSGSYVELYWSKTTANGQLQYKGTQVSPTRPATPSVIVTVTQVA
jgi:hypothetical protein